MTRIYSPLADYRRNAAMDISSLLRPRARQPDNIAGTINSWSTRSESFSMPVESCRDYHSRFLRDAA